MASWAPERRRMTPLPSHVEEARIKEAQNLLAWSAALEEETMTYAEFQEREEQ